MGLNTQDLLKQAEQAAANQATEGTAPTVPAITFFWGAECYAVPLAETRQVARVGTITPVPGLPPMILGAMNLRGEILPVADVRLLLGLAAGRPTATSRLVVVAADGEAVGLLVDAVGDVLELPASNPAQATSDLIAGQSFLPDGRLVNLLDLERALAALNGLNG